MTSTYTTLTKDNVCESENEQTQLGTVEELKQEEERIENLMFKRACDDGCSSENFELSELSGMESNEKNISDVKPYIRHQYQDLGTGGTSSANVCQAYMESLESAEKKDLQNMIEKYQKKCDAKKVQIQQLEAQYKIKLSDYANLQKQLDEKIYRIKGNQVAKKEAQNETRCLTQRNTQLAREVNTCKTDAQKTQKDLKQLVETRLNIQEKFHEQGKVFTQEFDALKNDYLDVCNQVASYKKTKATLDTETHVAEQNLKQQSAREHEIKKDLGQKRCEADKMEQQLANTRQMLDKTAAVIGNKEQQLCELKESMKAAEKLLTNSKQSTDKYQTQGDVLAAGLNEREEMANLLQDVVDTKQCEKNQLLHKISIFEGQLDQLSEVESSRKKSLQCGKTRLEYQQERLCQLKADCCARMAANMEPAGSSAHC